MSGFLDQIWKLENNTSNLIIISPNVIITYSSILAVKVLQGLWKNDLVALNGACPNCGEEVSLLYDCINLKVLEDFIYFLYNLSMDLYFILCNKRSYVSTSSLYISNNLNSIFLQVFAFVKPDQCNKSPHRADCHVCESLLEFRTKHEVI